jgi:hypothetical protein
MLFTAGGLPTSPLFDALPHPANVKTAGPLSPVSILWTKLSPEK